jgi:hypothetical protein
MLVLLSAVRQQSQPKVPRWGKLHRFAPKCIVQNTPQNKQPSAHVPNYGQEAFSALPEAIIFDWLQEVLFNVTYCNDHADGDGGDRGPHSAWQFMMILFSAVRRQSQPKFPRWGVVLHTPVHPIVLCGIITQTNNTLGRRRIFVIGYVRFYP